VKRVLLSPHAQEAAKERGIEPDWIARTLAKPERIEPDRRHAERRSALCRVAEFGGRWLRVVYVEDAESYRIVTVFFDRKARR
jgi:hypothetical protein